MARKPHRQEAAKHAAGVAPRITVRLETSEEAFTALAPAWNRLHSGAAAASAFNSWVWQYHWWQVYGAGQPLRILVALEGDEPVGILPLYEQATQSLGMQVRMLRLVGSGGDTHPDDLGPVIAAGREAAVAAALADALMRLPSADVVFIPDVQPGSAFPDALAEIARRDELAFEAGRAERIDYVDLPADWPAFLASLSASRRARMKSARKKLEAAHATRFFVWDDPAGLDAALERLAWLHRRRWQASGESESFATGSYIEFHRRILKAFFPRGWLRLYCLEVDGEIAAMTYCYRFRNRVYLVQAGFDPALSRVKPGTVLLGHALEHAIAEGNEVFDFLRGEHRYKGELATGSRETRFVRVFRPTLAARAYRLRVLRLPAWKARLKALALRLKP